MTVRRFQHATLNAGCRRPAVRPGTRVVHSTSTPHQYGRVLARALAMEGHTHDPVYRPYRADTTDLVPPPEPEPEWEPGCDRCGALDTRPGIDDTGAWHRLCPGHMAAEWTKRYAPFDLTRDQERLLVEWYRAWWYRAWGL